jgi:hypothetical protein
MTGAVRRSSAGRACTEVKCHEAAEHDNGSWLVQALHGLSNTVCRWQPAQNVDSLRTGRGDCICKRPHSPHAIGESATE